MAAIDMIRVVFEKTRVGCSLKESVLYAVPYAVVENVNYNADAVNATHAQLTWNAVDIDVRQIRGFFRGYQVTHAFHCIRYQPIDLETLCPPRSRGDNTIGSASMCVCVFVCPFPVGTLLFEPFDF